MKKSKIIKKEIYEGYEIYVLKINTELPIYWDLTRNTTYYNGYIVIPKSSKFYGRGYNFISSEIKIHGGFTFADHVHDRYVIGFDTAHYYDNKTTQNIKFVMKELKQAVDQIIEKESIK